MTSGSLTRVPVTGTEEICIPSADSHAIGMGTAVELTTVLKALADPLRLRILSAIASDARGEACVCDLAELGDVSQPTVSHHLKVLREVGILESERRATWVWYRITPGYQRAVTALLESFASTALDHGDDQPPTGVEGLRDVDPVLDRIIDELEVVHPAVGQDVVRRTVRESYAALARTASHTTHLVALAERFARQRLADLTRDPTTTPPQLLFVCSANAGRSQLAAGLVKHYAEEKVVVRSAGSAPAAAVPSGVRQLLADLGVDDSEVFPKPLTDDAVRAADVVITMGCGDVCPILPGVRYEDWAIGDPALASDTGLISVLEQLDQRIRGLLDDLLPELTLPEPVSARSTTL